MITIKYGPGNSVQVSDDKYDEVNEILEDEALKSILGFGGNVTVYVDGEQADPDDVVPVGAEVKLTQAACKKA